MNRFLYISLFFVISISCTEHRMDNEEVDPPTTSSVIRVPADYANLTAAFSSAVNGDTILLADGIYSGDDNFNYDYSWLDETIGESGGEIFRFEDSYIGAALKGGLLYRPNNDLSLGFSIESPLEWQVEQVFIDEFGDRDIFDYDLQRPMTLGFGFSYRFDKLNIAGDIEYIDWSDLAYQDTPNMEIYNDSLSILYRQVVNLRFGAEYQFPDSGILLRFAIVEDVAAAAAPDFALHLSLRRYTR